MIIDAVSKAGSAAEIFALVGGRYFPRDEDGALAELLGAMGDNPTNVWHEGDHLSVCYRDAGGYVVTFSGWEKTTGGEFHLLHHADICGEEG